MVSLLFYKSKFFYIYIYILIPYQRLQLSNLYFRSPNDVGQASPDNINAAVDSFSRLDIDEAVDSNPQPAFSDKPVINAAECKCGMPLCICVSVPDSAALEV